MLVSARISRLLDTCLSVIHNANYIVNSIVCAVILVRGSRVPAYGIRPMHGQIHIVNMHGTGTKHIVRHSQKSVVQWSVISKFTCILEYHYSDGAFGDGSQANITIRYYGKTDQFAKYRFPDISNFTVYI